MYELVRRTTCDCLRRLLRVESADASRGTASPFCRRATWLWSGTAAVGAGAAALMFLVVIAQIRAGFAVAAAMTATASAPAPVPGAPGAQPIGPGVTVEDYSVTSVAPAAPAASTAPAPT